MSTVYVHACGFTAHSAAEAIIHLAQGCHAATGPAAPELIKASNHGQPRRRAA